MTKPPTRDELLARRHRLWTDADVLISALDVFQAEMKSIDAELGLLETKHRRGRP